MTIKIMMFSIVFVMMHTSVLFADTWTNSVGHSVEAKLVDCMNGLVEFQRSNGKKFSMALRGLSEESQKIVLKAFPQPVKATTKKKARDRLQKRLDILKRKPEKAK